MDLRACGNAALEGIKHWLSEHWDDGHDKTLVDGQGSS